VLPLGPADIHADPLGILVAFGAGMLSFLSPCVLPLVPGYLSMVSGLSAAELDALRSPSGRGTAPRLPVPEVAAVGAPALAPLGGLPGPPGVPGTPGAIGSHPAEGRADGGVLPVASLARARARLLGGILAFIGGFTLVFVALGASASAVGRLLLTHQRSLEVASGVLIVALGAILVALAAGLRLPAFVVGERRLALRPSVLGSFAPPIMGMAFAFAWTPCIGPVLGSVLALAAGTGGSALGGVVLLTAYSLGLGVPFLLCGLAFGRVTDALGRVRHRLHAVEVLGGVVLVVFGLLLATGHVDVISSTIGTWLRDLHLGRLSTS
jgi:cytochrome c-type biogenesis protein